MTIKTEPVLAAGGLGVLITAADPLLQLFNVNGKVVAAACLSGAVLVLTLAVLVRQFVTPTSKLGREVAEAEKVVAVLEPGAAPIGIAVTGLPAPTVGT